MVILNDVLGELADLCKILQRSLLTPIEAFQFTKAKINKLRSQYLGDTVHYSNEVEEILALYDSGVNTTSILRFIQQVCDHMDQRIPERLTGQYLIRTLFQHS